MPIALKAKGPYQIVKSGRVNKVMNVIASQNRAVFQWCTRLTLELQGQDDKHRAEAKPVFFIQTVAVTLAQRMILPVGRVQSQYHINKTG